MNSSWLLIKTLRRRLSICAALCFVFLFLLAYGDARPSDLDKAMAISSLSLIVALISACFAGCHTALFKLPFPVTHRQLAWLPTLCLAAFWAAGLAGAFSGIGVLSLMRGPAYALARWTPFLLAVLKTLPFAFLAFAVADRLLRYLGFRATFFVVFLQFFFIGDRWGGLAHALVFYQYGWPLCIALGIFFILEAPAHIAAMDYPSELKQGLINLNVRTNGAPTRTPAIKVWADLFMALICLLSVICFVSKWAVPTSLSGPSTPFRIYLAGIGVAILFGIQLTWRGSQANGFSAGKTFAIFLMKCSLVLVPITWLWGAKHGVVARCLQCSQYKFLWAHRCPHCGHVNRGKTVRVFPLLPWKKDQETPLAQKRVSSRMLFRFLLPFYLVAFSFINYEGRFRSETVTLIPTPEGITTAFPEISEYLASVDDVRGWLGGGGDTPLLLPERFRIEARELGPQVLEVKCYWLRWEDAGAVGEGLRARILDAFPNAQFTVSDGASRSDYARGRVNRAALPSYLDGGIHWIPQ